MSGKIWFGLVLALCPVAAQAHFGMIIPSRAMVTQEDGRALDLTLSFSHPFESIGMDMAPPEAFTVTHADETRDLLPDIRPEEVMGKAGFMAEVQLGRPGAYVFALTPQPYWEPAEDSFIQHYTKTYVAAFDDDTGWDTELGLKTEIVPLTRPFGLWAGNVFQGIVKVDGAPVPFAEVEVEHFNTGGATAPNELMITQTVKADENGVFTYATPASGWWGFAALSTANYKLPFEDTPKDLELGAVLWVHFEDWR